MLRDLSSPPANLVDWWSFDFDRLKIPAFSTAGTLYYRTVPIGMPRIPPQVLYSTFYLYRSVKDARNGAKFGGTGFFVGYPTGEPSAPTLLYAVTNWHVAVRGGASVVRINKLGGGVDILEFDPGDWEFPPGGHDVAVLSHQKLGIKESVHEIVSLSLEMFLSKIDVARLEIGPGEDIFMIGRFVDHDGAAGNIPSARFGNISVMPQPVLQPTGAELESFILDVHSRTGYSGSPVFVYRAFGSDLTTDELGKDLLTSERGLVAAPHKHFVKLLGLHWGQFPEEWEIRFKKKTIIGEVSAHGDPRYIEGMSGMTMASPAWAIREFLNMPKFREECNKTLNQILEARGSKRGPVAESSVPADDAANPRHLEDFTRLVDVAAQKRPRDDQT